jgi:hypothetical protein
MKQNTEKIETFTTESLPLSAFIIASEEADLYKITQDTPGRFTFHFTPYFRALELKEKYFALGELPVRNVFDAFFELRKKIFEAKENYINEKE